MVALGLCLSFSMALSSGSENTIKLANQEIEKLIKPERSETYFHISGRTLRKVMKTNAFLGYLTMQ
jgi:hypothetical protein